MKASILARIGKMEGVTWIRKPRSLPSRPEDWAIYGPMINLKGACSALGVSPKTVKKWAEAGFIRYCDSPYSYSAEDVAKVAEKIDGYKRPDLPLLRHLFPNTEERAHGPV